MLKSGPLGIKGLQNLINVPYHLDYIKVLNFPSSNIRYGFYRYRYHFSIITLINFRPPFEFRTSSILMIFYYLVPLQNDSIVTSQCVQFTFGDKREVYLLDESALYNAGG